MPEGQTGEVWLETVRNLKEYWRDAEATRRAFPEGRNDRGGWFRTGDGGYVEDGYLYINDRIKDMVISGGENIYPAEIENLLMKHPAVFDGAIIGVPDAKWGEAVKACVVLRPGMQATQGEIIDLDARAPRALQAPKEHRLRGRPAAQSERQGPEAGSAGTLLEGAAESRELSAATIALR